MSDVSKFKIIDKVVNVKDNEGRALTNTKFNTLDNRINETNSNLNETNSKVDAIIKKFSNFVNVVTDFGADNTANTDSTEALKNAFATRDAFIYFPEGNYIISDSIKINSNTYVYGYRAVIQNSSSNNMFINNSDGTIGGYSANNNITIDGLRFVGLNMVQTIIAFSHAINIKILNCEFYSNSPNHDEQNWHLVEINSCKYVDINKCTFGGTSTFKTEMLQLDVATEHDVFPWFGPYDKTPCSNINITNCFFYHPEKYGFETLETKDAAIGNHNGSDSSPINFVNIMGCAFSNVKTIFKFEYLANSTISNNFAVNCQSGFAYSSYHIIKNVKIVDNTLIGNKDDYTEKASNSVLGRGISIGNLNGQLNENIIVSGNTVQNFVSHGIAINGVICEICNNIIRSCGATGLYCGYDSYKCSYHDNIAQNNGALDNLAVDILVSQTKNENVTLSGGNAIYDNRCDTMKAVIGTTNLLPTVIRNNNYVNFTNPTLKTDDIKIYGNSDYRTNSNNTNSSGTISASQTALSTWNTVYSFTATHTSYLLASINFIFPNTFNSGYVSRIAKNGEGFVNEITCPGKEMPMGASSLTGIVLAQKGDVISGDLYFKYGEGITGKYISTIIELPVAP